LILLAVETSGAQASIALQVDGQSSEMRLLDSTGRRHTQTLVSEVDRMLRQRSLQPQEVDVVAVSIGPGSFTGLRVGLVFAKTFAWINHASLVAVSTLRAIVEQAPVEYSRLTAVVDAQRGELFAADFTRDSENLFLPCSHDIRYDIRIVMPEQLAADRFITGPGVDTLKLDRYPELQLLPAEYRQPNAAAVACVGAELFAAGTLSDPSSLEPVYVRRSYAEEKKPPALQNRDRHP
jgi:tRNA threonylcarbamoyladenosine biosynthesis protein TsaB